MKALQCLAYGEPSGLVLRDLPDPDPLAGEVLLSVEAAGLGFVDALHVRGGYQVKRPLPFTPGTEVAGRVLSVGADVDAGLVGKRLMALSPVGALAEKITLPAAVCTEVPDGMSAEIAAGFIVSYCTALYGFQDCGALQPGECVLVLGAGGSVGVAAIDVAKAMGAHVVAAAASAEKREAAKGQGADQVLDYSSPDWRKALVDLLAGRGVDLVYDPVGGDFSETAFRCLAPRGRHLVVGFAAGSIPKLPLNLALLKRASLVGVDWGGYIRAHPAEQPRLLSILTDWFKAGRLKPIASPAHTLAEAPAVLQALVERRSVGKPVIRVA